MITNPIFLIGCPRSGTSLLFNLLAEIPDLWSIGYESKEIIEKYHHPGVKNWISGALESNDVTEISKKFIISEFEKQAASGEFWGVVNRIRSVLRKTRILTSIKNRGKTRSLGAEFSSNLPHQGLNLIRSYVRTRNKIIPSLIPEKICLLEKTPENCLRLPFLLEIFPDARILYLIRDGRANISSLMEGWKQPHLFPGYKVPEKIRISGDTRGRWAFTLIPRWRELLERPLEEVCAWQWIECNQAVIDFFELEGKGVPYIQIKYEQLISNPTRGLANIYEFLGLQRKYSSSMSDFPKINVVSPPDPDKWRKNQEKIERVLPIMKPMLEKLEYL
jgi:hypothetical protein